MIQFEIGDVVQLKSGGALMTVRSVPYALRDVGGLTTVMRAQYTCIWSDCGELREGTFFPAELQHNIVQVAHDSAGRPTVGIDPCRSLLAEGDIEGACQAAFGISYHELFERRLQQKGALPPEFTVK